MDCRIPEGPGSVAIITTYLGVCNAPMIMLFILSFPDGNKLPACIRHGCRHCSCIVRGIIIFALKECTG